MAVNRRWLTLEGGGLGGTQYLQGRRLGVGGIQGEVIVTGQQHLELIILILGAVAQRIALAKRQGRGTLRAEGGTAALGLVGDLDFVAALGQFGGHQILVIALVFELQAVVRCLLVDGEIKRCGDGFRLGGAGQQAGECQQGQLTWLEHGSFLDSDSEPILRSVGGKF